MGIGIADGVVERDPLDQLWLVVNDSAGIPADELKVLGQARATILLVLPEAWNP